MNAVRVYRQMLRLLPTALREHHGDAMQALFEEEVADARRRGRLAAAMVAIRCIGDLLLRAPYEHWRRLGRPRQARHSGGSRMAASLEPIRMDIRFALRSLRRRPVFATVAILTIALSIGAATVVYGVVDGVLFRSLPYRDADQLVWVWQTDEVSRKQAVISANWDRVPLDYTDFLVWRERQQSFEGVAAWSGFGAMMQGTQGPEQVIGTRVSPGLFELLGVAPILGRTFARGEDAAGAPNVTMISYEAWQSRHGRRPDIIGSKVFFGAQPFQIIGVLPQGFTLERGKTGAPYWVPAGMEPGDIGKRNRSFFAIGKLKPGVTREQATAEASRLLSTQDPPGAPTKGVRLADFVREETRDVRGPMLMLLGAVGVLLLISCVNIATLLLGEASTRETEMSTRVAIGASRGRIVRQLLTESTLLSMAGSAIGVVLAWWGTRLVVASAPPKIPGILGVHVDGRVLGVALIVTIATGMMFGLAPALTLSHAGSARVLRSGRATSGNGSLQRSLVAVELALCVMLLVGAGLLARSLQRLSSVDPGFRSDRLIVVRLSLSLYRKDSVAVATFYHEAPKRIAAIPGVVAVTGMSNVPFSGGASSSPYLLVGEGDAEMRARKHEVQQRVVLDDYFRTLGVPIIAGRSFEPGDQATTEPVAIISEAAARRDFPSVAAVGQLVKYQGAWRRIIGVARDTKARKLSIGVQPSIYTPWSQRFEMVDLVVRTASDPVPLAPIIRRVTQEAGPRFAITNVQVMDDLIRASFAEERFRTTLVLGFGAIAALLVSIGMFGVTARAVARRTREVGIRVALGATTSSVVAMVVRQTMTAVLVGIVFGLGCALAASRVIAPYLFGITTTDPLTYLSILALVLLVALVASWLPARRAGRVEPALVMRSE